MTDKTPVSVLIGSLRKESFSRKVAQVGGVVTWDTPAGRDGTFAPEFLAQLKAIREAIHTTPVQRDSLPDAHETATTP